MQATHRETSLTCVEELVLLALDEETGRMSSRFHSRRHSIGGAVLMDLVLAERIRVEDRIFSVIEEPIGAEDRKLTVHEDPLAVAGWRLSVIDTSPIGIPYLDRTLEEIVATPSLRAMNGWLTRIGHHAGTIEAEAVDRLVARKLIRREERRRLVLWKELCHPTTDGQAERRLKRRLVDALLGDGRLSPRDAALVALVDHAGLLPTVLSRREAHRASARTAEARRQSQIGGLLHEDRARVELEVARHWAPYM